MNSQSCPTPKRPNLNYHLFHKSKTPDALRHVIIDLSRAAKYISYALQTTESGLAGSQNEFGEEQLTLDVLSDRIIQEYLCESSAVSCYVSEEQNNIVELELNAPYSVVYDPLDGSSLVEANFAIGSIFGIYKGADIIGRKPRDMVAAFYVLYGPRTLFVYSTGEGTHEFILNDVGEFILLREHLKIAGVATHYSPGNLRAVNQNSGYKHAMQQWMDDEMTLRYSGCMVADIHHILSKGQGIFSNVGGSTYPEGKLRHVFECGPFAYLIEQAGGSATDGSMKILDKKISSAGQRTPFIAGSKTEVERTSQILVA